MRKADGAKKPPFIKKGQKLLVAFYKDPEIKWDGRKKVGEALKHFKENAKSVPAKFGSYEEAWNCEAMKWLREHY